MTDPFNRPEPNPGITLGDYASTLGNIGGSAVAGAIPATTRYLADQFDNNFAKLVSAGSEYLQGKFGDYSQDSFDALNPDAQAALSAEISSPEFWSTSAIGLKASAMLPSVAASVAAVVFAPASIPALASVGVTSGALSTGQTLDELYRLVDDKTDGELQERSDIYRGLREMGATEEVARRELSNIMIGYKPAMLFALGAATGTFGPAAQAVKGLGIRGASHAAGSGIRSRAGKALAEGAISEGIQTGGESAATEQGGVDAGFQDEINWGVVASGAGEGAVLGGVLGGVAGIPSGRRAEEAADSRIEAPAASNIRNEGRDTIPYPVEPDPDEVIPTSGPAPSRRRPGGPIAYPVEPDAAPPQDQAKGKARAKRPVVTNPAGGNIAPAEAGALAASKPKAPAAVAPEIAAASTRVQDNVTPPVQAANAVPPAPGVPPVPPTEAQQAAQAYTPNRPGGPGVQPAAPAPVAPAATPATPPAQAAPVTSEVRPEDVTYTPRPQDGRRVLPATETQAKMARLKAERLNAEAAARKVADEAAAKKAKVDEARAKKKEQQHVHGAPKPLAKNLGKAFAKKNDDAIKANEIFDAMEPDERPIPKTPAELSEFKLNLDAIVKAADDANINVPNRVTEDTTSDYIVYLREAKTLQNKLENKSFVGPKRTAAIREFIASMALAKRDGFAEIRERRRVEGDAAKGQSRAISTKADIEPENDAVVSTDTIAEEEGQTTPDMESEQEANPELDIEEDAVKARISKGRVVDEAFIAPGFGEGAASRPRKVEITPELKVRLEAQQAELDAKNARAKVVGERKAEVASEPKTVVEPEAAPKAAAAKKVSKARAEKKAPAKKAGPAGEKAKAVAKKPTPEKTPDPVSTTPLQDRAEAAARGTDPDATPAQREAGNYRKPAFNAFGLTFRIETARGEMRRGEGWAVRMPDHYGYIEGTEGADSTKTRREGLDVTIGPDLDTATHAFVIDQQDPDTFAPDERKSFVGFQDLRAATNSYFGSFSDGRGSERMANVRVMTIPEWKTWVQTQKKSDLVDADLKVTPEVTSEVTREGHPWAADYEQLLIDDPSYETRVPWEVYIDRREGGMEMFRAMMKGGVLDSPMTAPAGWETVEAEPLSLGDLESESFDPTRPYVKSSYGGVANVIEEVSFRDVVTSLGDSNNNLSGLYGKTHPILRKLLLRSIGDVPVKLVSARGMENLWPDYGKNVLGYYSDNDNIIIINEDALALSPARRSHVLLHEAVHAATLNALRKDGKSHALVSSLMREVAPHMSPDRYGMVNAAEFLAEAMTNPEFQTELASIPISKEMADRLNIADWRKATAWTAFVDVVRNILALPRSGVTALEAAISMAERTSFTRDPDAGAAYYDRLAANRRATMTAERFLAKRRASALPETTPFIDANAWVERLRQPSAQMSAPRAVSLRTMDQLAQIAKDYGKEFGRIARKVADTVEMIRVTSTRIMDEAAPLIHELYRLEREYKGKDWDEFTSVVHDSVMAQVHPDRTLKGNAHLGKDDMNGYWGKDQHAELSARFQALPAPLQAAYAKTRNHYTKMQREMSLGLIKNGMLKALGIKGPKADEIAGRMIDGKETQEDKDLLDDAYSVIKKSDVLRSTKGPYFALMRRGKFVARGRYIIKPPSNGRTIRNNEYEFSGKDARDKAIAFARSLPMTNKISSRLVDKVTGSRYFTDVDGKNIRVTEQDADAERRYRVVVQDEHVEFFDTAQQAQAATDALKADGVDMLGIEPVTFTHNDSRADMLSTQFQTLLDALQRRQSFRELPAAEQAEVIQTLRTQSLAVLGATRIQSRRLPRAYVAGASKDLTRNALEYTQSASGYLGRLRHQPDLDEAMVALEKERRQDESTSLGKGTIANEIKKRVEEFRRFEESTTFDGVVQRTLAFSFLRHLFSPAYSMVNATQPIMLTLPHLASSYGSARAAAAMLKAYRDIGTGAIVKKGAVETYRKGVDPDADNNTLFEDLLARIPNAKERRFLERMAEVGSIDPGAGIEVDQLVKSRYGAAGKLDTGISWAQGMARQMPLSVEMINRAVTGLATFRLEMLRNGGDVDAATLTGQEQINLTQGLYSTTNAAPIFHRHPLLRLSLQFKKYGQLVYGLIAHDIGKAIRNASPGDREAAVKSLLYMTATHVVMAGALGLPTEPLKWFVMALNTAGVTELTWADAEDGARQVAADLFGQGIGEVVTRGVSRALPGGLAIDLSSRLGMSDLMTFGEPRSNETHDLQAYISELVGGAPGSMVLGFLKGGNKLMVGDPRGFEGMLPIKAGVDMIKAYRLATEGKVTAAGYQSMKPYNAAEAIVQAIGFTPGRAAETNANRSRIYRQQGRNSEQRSNFMRLWNSSTSSERARLWGKIEKHNRNLPRDQRITRSELETYRKRRKSEKVEDGVVVNRRNRSILDAGVGVYNTN